MLPEENEEQVSKFLATYPMFELIPLADIFPNLAETTHSDFLSLTPARHDTDGFFAAVLRRKPEAS
jgi:16S rRNA (cytosine967-C5)-methyltransferase